MWIQKTNVSCTSTTTKRVTVTMPGMQLTQVGGMLQGKTNECNHCTRWTNMSRTRTCCTTSISTSIRTGRRSVMHTLLAKKTAAAVGDLAIIVPFSRSWLSSKRSIRNLKRSINRLASVARGGGSTTTTLMTVPVYLITGMILGATIVEKRCLMC